MVTKNQRIKATLKDTKARRKHMRCRVYTVKLDRSHVNHESLTHLKRLFVEAKWLYNYCVGHPNMFSIDDKITVVSVKVKDCFEHRQLRYLSSHMRQSIITRTQQNIRSLARAKAKGHKVGRLKFKSYINSISLKQYGNTYRILNGNYVRIQGIPQKLRVNGLEQLPPDCEYAIATLLHQHGAYYLAITTYTPQEHSLEMVVPEKSIGIDFGVKHQLTLSNGIRIRYKIPVTRRTKQLCKQLSRKRYRSKNWWKTLFKLLKAYAKTTNIKRDIRNKLVHFLCTTFQMICYQNENLRSWQRLWGRRMLSTSLGGIIRMLEAKVQTPVEVDRFFPSTKTCSRCGHQRTMSLADRTYVYQHCGLVIDRDYNSSCVLEHEGHRILGRGPTEVTPAETNTSTLALAYLNQIAYVEASMVVETGSLTALA
ncbi:transposase [Candidatus Borrarchaeum sp.]|uniref:RNA-guided endonuclease InsQ/TnpB family protein n=1 Tax=Candidatus Borrarchaeum sp. TaxID=2846742 RepID=UPI00257F784F|nr:transposase [Candidatus Borrarchaeum sp.]